MYHYKVVILFLLSLVLSVSVYSQNTYRKYYDYSIVAGNNNSEIALCGVELDSNLTLLGISNLFYDVDDTLGFSRMQIDLPLIDQQGNIIDTFILYRKGFVHRTRDIFKKDSNTIVAFCTSTDLVKFKNQNIGDFISIAELNLKTKQVTYHDIDLGLGDEIIVKTLRDSNGYTILSQICNQAITNCDVSILRIDTNYAIEWHKVYTYNNNTFENPRDITELNDDYYFTTTSIPPGGTQFSTVHKLGNDGDSLITRALSTPGYEYTFLLSLVAKSESVLVAGSVINPDKEFPVFYELNNNLSTIRSYIDKSLDLKIRTDNILIKENHIYSSGTTGEYTNPREARNSLSKYDMNFNKLWTRVYSDSLLINRGEYIYNILPLSNKDWMFMGFGTNPNSTIKNQDAVFVRVDSNGCLYNTCLNVGIKEELYYNEIIVYPNPAKDIIYLEYPIHFQIKSLRIIDMLGNAINQELYKPKQISIKELNSGIYILQLTLGNGEVVNKRILKE